MGNIDLEEETDREKNEKILPHDYIEENDLHEEHDEAGDFENFQRRASQSSVASFSSSRMKQSWDTAFLANHNQTANGVSATGGGGGSAGSRLVAVETERKSVSETGTLPSLASNQMSTGRNKDFVLASSAASKSAVFEAQRMTEIANLQKNLLSTTVANAEQEEEFEFEE
eukprot:GDKK01002694.1.p1 GENE.GDKK01002694.1~~GDKK01002694.1.p1  ORF type:complete len:186 (-),score=53.58 GDKK01002694.1:70-582(-)